MVATAPNADLMRGVSSPPLIYSLAFAVTKHDTNNFLDAANVTVPCNALYVGGTGDVVAVMGDGSTATFVGVPAGTIIPLRMIRVNSTNTTATSMVALW